MTSFPLANTPFAGGIARRIARGFGGVAVFAALWLPTCVAAQSIHGVVLDGGSGNPIPAAEVRLLGPGDSAIAQYSTGEDGRFSFRTLRAGSYRLRASRIADC